MNYRTSGNLSKGLKITDNEIYMIKDYNIKRVHDIIKNSVSAKPTYECEVYILLHYYQIQVDSDLDNNNKSIIDSMKSTRELFDQIYNIQSTKKSFQNKLECKYKYICFNEGNAKITN